MQHEGPEAAEAGGDLLAVVGVQPDLARQGQQAQGLFQVQPSRGPALGQAGALGLVAAVDRRRLLDIGAEAAVLQPHRATGRRIDPQLLVGGFGLAFAVGRRGQLAGEAAFGIVRAADEGPELADLQRQHPRSAGWAQARVRPVALVGEDVRAQRLVQRVEHVGGAQLGDLADGGVEVLPEVAEELLPVQLAVRHQVQLLFQRGGEVVLHVAAEELLEERGDQAALVLGNEALLVHADIFAVAQHGQHRGVGRRPADAQLFHLLDQAGFRIARGRLGEVLVGAGVQHLGGRAFFDHRQAGAVLVALVVAAFLVDGQIAWEQDDLAGGAHAGLAVGALQVDSGALDAGALHLRGDHPLPDQLVETPQVRLQAQRAGVAGEAGRADGFVGLLGVLGLGLVVAWGLGDVGRAIDIADHAARLGDALGLDRHAVGPHVGDQADGLAADVDAFVQLLGGLHGALGREAQLARGFLLQGRGSEGRGGRALAGLLLDGGDLEGGLLHGGAGGQGRGLVAQVELGELLVLVFDQAGQERLGAGRDIGLDGPVFLGLEALDLQLAIDDQPQADRLHTAGRTAAGQLAPQDWRKREADQIVQGAAGEVGLDQLHVDVARMGHGLEHRGLGDGVEGDALDGLVLHRLLLLQHLQHVPADRFPFAVGVGGQDDAVGALHGVDDVADPLGRLGVDLPVHVEVVVRLHRAVLGRQVADVAVRGQHREAGAEVLIDGLGLGRALDDDDDH